MHLEGKVAIVTGASRGIGRAVAINLAQSGADVVVNYSGSEGAAQETVEAVQALGRKAIKIKAPMLMKLLPWWKKLIKNLVTLIFS